MLSPSAELLADQLTFVPLRDCGRWLSGGTPSTEEPSFWDGDIPWITASSLTTFHLEDSERKLTELGLQNGSRLVPQGAILFVVRGMSLKSEFRMGITLRPCAFGQDCKAILPSNDFDPLFLAYAIKAKTGDILELVDEAGHGTGRLQTDLLSQLPIPAPPLAKQHRISEILGSLDDKIELNRRMNRTLEELARAAFKAWFVDFLPVRAKQDGAKSFPGTDADTFTLFPDSFEDSPLGPIPNGWRVSTVGEEVRVVGGSTPNTANPDFWNGEHCWVTPRDLARVKSPVLLGTERCISDAGVRQISSGLLPAGTVLLSSRAPIGYVAIAEVPAAINQGFIALRCEGEIPKEFVWLWLQQNMETIIGRANGTTFLEISKSNFRPIPMIVPSSPLIDSFRDFVSPLWGQFAANERESRTLAATRDLLLPRLLSGYA